MEAFILHALIAGICVAIVCAPLGCFIVWKKMAYFGDSLAHSSLLGIALGLLFGVNINLSILIIAVVFTALLLWLQRQHLLTIDTLLGILAHAALAFGMIMISLNNTNIDVYSYLFGDILSVTSEDIWIILVGGICVLSILIYFWSSLTLVALNEDLAQAEGISTLGMNFLFMLLMSIVVAISIQIVGIILITSLLIIPAATARQWAKSPPQMVFMATVFAVIAVIMGFYGSLQFDTPSGPSIVASASIIFVLVVITKLVLSSNTS